MEEEHQKKLEEERQHSYEERAPCRKNWKNRNLRWTRWKRNMQKKKQQQLYREFAIKEKEYNKKIDELQEN